jgi:hypothetical protein
MRRSLVMTLILAIFAIFLATAPAGAAANNTAAPSAGTASPSTFGTVCRTVRANARHQGVICVGLAVQDNKLNRYVSAVVTLRPGSGTLTRASARQLVLYIGGHIAQSGVYRRQHLGGAFSLSTRNRNLWDGRPGMPAVRVRVGLLDACMYWPDGSRACTGSHWLYSGSERILP